MFTLVQLAATTCSKLPVYKHITYANLSIKYILETELDNLLLTVILKTNVITYIRSFHITSQGAEKEIINFINNLMEHRECSIVLRGACNFVVVSDGTSIRMDAECDPSIRLYISYNAARDKMVEIFTDILKHASGSKSTSAINTPSSLVRLAAAACVKIPIYSLIAKENTALYYNISKTDDVIVTLTIISGGIIHKSELLTGISSTHATQRLNMFKSGSLIRFGIYVGGHTTAIQNRNGVIHIYLHLCTIRVAAYLIYDQLISLLTALI